MPERIEDIINRGIDQPLETIDDATHGTLWEILKKTLKLTNLNNIIDTEDKTKNDSSSDEETER